MQCDRITEVNPRETGLPVLEDAELAEFVA
jgi:hypothetical protein